MKILYTEKFSKDLDSIAIDEKLKKRLLQLLQELQQKSSLAEIRNIRKIHGYKGYFRVRMGDYCVGVKATNDEVAMLRFLHRKDIYKKFP
mgnify:CR=1 FL=1